MSTPKAWSTPQKHSCCCCCVCATQLCGICTTLLYPQPDSSFGSRAKKIRSLPAEQPFLQCLVGFTVFPKHFRKYPVEIVQRLELVTWAHGFFGAQALGIKTCLAISCSMLHLNQLWLAGSGAFAYTSRHRGRGRMQGHIPAGFDKDLLAPGEETSCATHVTHVWGQYWTRSETLCLCTTARQTQVQHITLGGWTSPPSWLHKFVRRWLRLRTGVLRNHTWGYLGPRTAHNQEPTDLQGWDISWDHPRVVEPGGHLSSWNFCSNSTIWTPKPHFGSDFTGSRAFPTSKALLI